MIRAFNATQEVVGGPFKSFSKAVEWAKEHLPDGAHIDIKELKKAFKDEGIVSIDEDPSKSFAEDVVIFDDERHEMDEEGYVDW